MKTRTKLLTLAALALFTIAAFQQVDATSQPTCGPQAYGHTIYGNQPDGTCSEDGLPLWGKHSHQFQDPGDCPYDGVLLSNGHVIPGM
jgi:hypothetical protein